MRYLKRLIAAVLIYIALYLPFVVIMQTLTGYDFTAAYTIGGAFGAVELALGSLIKINENRASKKDAERKSDE
jgi:multidrug transporter EmrE-like cation transporter